MSITILHSQKELEIKSKNQQTEVDTVTHILTLTSCSVEKVNS